MQLRTTPTIIANIFASDAKRSPNEYNIILLWQDETKRRETYHGTDNVQVLIITVLRLWIVRFQLIFSLYLSGVRLFVYARDWCLFVASSTLSQSHSIVCIDLCNLFAYVLSFSQIFLCAWFAQSNCAAIFLIVYVLIFCVVSNCILVVSNCSWHPHNWAAGSSMSWWNSSKNASFLLLLHGKAGFNQFLGPSNERNSLNSRMDDVHFMFFSGRNDLCLNYCITKPYAAYTIFFVG